MKKLFIGLFILGAAYTTTAQTVDKRDLKFAKCAAEGNMMEAQLGKLAQSNGSATEVVELGRKMEDEHTKANDELKGIAAKKSISLPASMSDKQQRCYNKMALLSGKEFDKKFTKHMVKDHKKDLCLFKKERKKGKDSELQAWAANKVPALEQHLQMSKDACKAVKR